MTTFQDLSNELIFNIAEHLAPTRCEDSNLDLLAFRAVDRRTWLLANEIAFRRMTVFVQDAERFKKFSDFYHKGRLDAAGRDMRKYVKEVRVYSPPYIRVEGTYICGDMQSRDDKFYMEQSQHIFRRLLQQPEDQELNAGQKAASQHYFELCIKPYIEGPPQGHHLQPLIAGNLQHLVNLQTVTIAMNQHFPNTSSAAWQALKEVGITDNIYDENKKRFHRIWNQELPFVIKHDDGSETWSFNDPTAIDYTTNRHLKIHIFKALPSSVTRLRCEHGQYDLIPEDITEKKMFTQITEFDTIVDQNIQMLMPRMTENIHARFPNLKILRLRSRLDEQGQYALWCEDSPYVEYRINIMPKLLENMSEFPYLETLHVDGYVMNSHGFRAIVEFAARHNLRLVLENAMILRTAALGAQPISAQESYAFWLGLAQVVRDKFPEYMASGRVQLRGAITCVSVCVGWREMDPVVLENKLVGQVTRTFQGLLCDGRDSEKVRSEMLKWTSPVEVKKRVNWGSATKLTGDRRGS